MLWKCLLCTLSRVSAADSPGAVQLGCLWRVELGVLTGLGAKHHHMLVLLSVTHTVPLALYCKPLSVERPLRLLLLLCTLQSCVYSGICCGTRHLSCCCLCQLTNQNALGCSF
jgi:hypothetical protein